MTNTATDSAAPKKQKQLLNQHEGVKTTFYVLPEQLVIDGLDNDKPVSAGYNAERLKEDITVEDVMSIIKFGVLLPVAIKVEKVPGPDGVDKIPTVLDGRNRVRRARMANRWIADHLAGKKLIDGYAADHPFEPITVLCFDKKPSDEIEELEMSIAANSGRVVDGPRRLALAAQALAAAGRSAKSIEATLGKDAETIRCYLKLGGASSKLTKALDNGVIDVTGASRLADLPKDEQNLKLEELVAKAGPKGKVTKEAATVAARNAKAEKKNKDKGTSKPKRGEKRTTGELRHVAAGLAVALAEGDARTAEHRENQAMLTAIQFVLGEVPAKGDDEGDERHKRLMRAISQGKKAKE